jgi:hypothetical protein
MDLNEGTIIADYLEKDGRVPKHLAKDAARVIRSLVATVVRNMDGPTPANREAALQALYDEAMRVVLDTAIPKAVADQCIWAPALKDVDSGVPEQYEALLDRVIAALAKERTDYPGDTALRAKPERAAEDVRIVRIVRSPTPEEFAALGRAEWNARDILDRVVALARKPASA